MDFSAVVQKARQILAQGVSSSSDKKSQDQEQTDDAPGAMRDLVYGRVCTTVGKDPPEMLSSDKQRRTVFIFGPDAVESIIISQSSYDILCSIGRDKQYLFHTVVEKQSTFWLILFTADATWDSKHLTIAPATWDGVIENVRELFPEVTEDLTNNIQTLKERRFEDFEEAAGFEFLECKKNRDGKGDPGSPPYFSYEYFCSLPKPRAAWQVRAFLYCELRLLKLFTGDGYTCNEGGSGRRIVEYLGPNIRIADLDPSKCAVLKMKVEYSEILKICYC